MNIILVSVFLIGILVFDFLPMLRKGNAKKRKIVLYIAAALASVAVVIMFEIRADFLRISHLITKFINSIMRL